MRSSFGGCCRTGYEANIGFMFTIDFLKTKGLPEKPRFFEVGLLTGVAGVLLLGLCLLGTQYFYNKSVLRSKQKALSHHESMLAKTSGEDSQKSRIEKKLDVYDRCYFEIAGSIGRYVQWTPVLREFVELLPPSMLLNELSVMRTISKKKVTSTIDPKKKVDIEIINRTLKSNVYDFMPETQGTAVENYLADLRSSQPLKGILEETYIVESSEDEYEGSNNKTHNVKKHIITCVLKSQEIANAK